MVEQFSDQELEAYLSDTESDRVERKENFSQSVRDKVRQAVCAFANDLPNHKKPGFVFIGVDDDGNPVGISKIDELLCNLGAMKTDGQILPLPTLFVEKRIIKDKELAVVVVYPSDMPPVKYEGRIWIRTGPRRGIASEQDERILNEKRRHQHRFFDIVPIPTAKIEDLSRYSFENDYLPYAVAKDILESNNRTYEERLASCKMISNPDDTIPTLLGLLTIGKLPQDHIPGAYIQILRIAGNELTDEVIDEAEYRGTFTDILRNSDEKLKSHNRTSIDITSEARHKRKELYPQAGLQQILYNAILHRTYEGSNAPVRIHWYNDRIEFHSPGGPYGNVTQENFGQPGITDYRNPNVAEVLKNLGFVQQFGRGISLARKLLKENGNKEPEFTVNESMVVCTFWSAA